MLLSKVEGEMLNEFFFLLEQNLENAHHLLCWMTLTSFLSQRNALRKRNLHVEHYETTTTPAILILVSIPEMKI